MKRFIYPTARLVRAFGLIGIMGTSACFQTGQAASSQPELSDLIQAADGVISDPDGVRAGKNAGKIFLAAHALEAVPDFPKALRYFHSGLQLSPWNLQEQLAYAELLSKNGRRPEASEIARMVNGRAENDAVCNQARRLLGLDPVIKAEASSTLPDHGPFICLVQVGEVNQVALTASIKKLHETLGVPILLVEKTVPLRKAHRSAFDRWVRQTLCKGVNWETAVMKRYLADQHKRTPEDLSADQVIGIVRTALSAEGRKTELDGLEESVAFYRAHDQQWDAALMLQDLAPFTASLPRSGKVVMIGITEADLYSGTSNYLFGSAVVGGMAGTVSYSRYRADFFGEPPDLTRLTSRMHKQLLSSIGNALGVPRPTDPTSARSYPASLPEHDAKSEYMSEACIAGFEGALGIKLPITSHKPAGSR